MYKGKLTKATVHSAGYDIHSTSNHVIKPGHRELVNTGVFLHLNTGTFGLIKSRSGLSCKGIDVGAGVIDCDYTAEIKVLIINNGIIDFNIGIGDRIAQLIVLNTQNINPINLHEGFGSTGY